MESNVSVATSNNAIGGRSSRSYTREGRFDEIAAVVQSGDYVVIEFGHNDGGSLSEDNGRSVCSGEGDETCETVYEGVAETVLTFPAYLENASAMFIELGANVLISSQTPNNPWESGSFVYEPSRFVGYAVIAAENAGVEYVDHGAYTAAIMEELGYDGTYALFPSDHTHTNDEGASVVANAFFKAVLCSGAALGDVVTASEESLPGSCL